MSDKMREALDKAIQLSSIASDWNLDEVEIDGDMVSIYDLKAEFTEALAQAEQHGEVLGRVVDIDGEKSIGICAATLDRLPVGTLLYTTPPAPAVPAWRQFPEQVPDPDTECLVEVAFNGALYRAVDTWEMQRYMPVEWSSATVEIGYGWSAHDDVQRWIPISSIAAPPAPVVPDDTARLNWLEGREASLVTHREAIDEGEFAIWWTVTGEIRKIRSNSISGHPLGSVRSAIDAAMLSAAPEVKP